MKIRKIAAMAVTGLIVLTGCGSNQTSSNPSASGTNSASAVSSESGTSASPSASGTAITDIKGFLQKMSKEQDSVKTYHVDLDSEMTASTGGGTAKMSYDENDNTPKRVSLTSTMKQTGMAASTYQQIIVGADSWTKLAGKSWVKDSNESAANYPASPKALLLAYTTQPSIVNSVYQTGSNTYDLNLNVSKLSSNLKTAVLHLKTNDASQIVYTRMDASYKDGSTSYTNLTISQINSMNKVIKDPTQK